jgi:hypothetical protein
MIKNVLIHIGGIERYGILSICLFFLVFTTAVVLAWRMKPSDADRLGALPLDDGSPVGGGEAPGAEASEGDSSHE